MNATLNVNTEKLKSTASSFQQTGNQIQTLTQQMTSLINEISGNVWSGDAASAYKKQFSGLSDDIQKMIKMVNEHVSDLNEIAAAYETAETESISLAGQLAADVIV